MLNSDKMLINGVDMNIKLTRAPESFLSFSPFRLQKSAYKDFRRYCFHHSSRIETPLLLDHAKVLAMKRIAH